MEKGKKITYGGNVYREWYRGKLKREANEIARDHRKLGYGVRMVKARKYYSLYIRDKTGRKP